MSGYKRLRNQQGGGDRRSPRIGHPQTSVMVCFLQPGAVRPGRWQHLALAWKSSRDQMAQMARKAATDEVMQGGQPWDPEQEAPA